MIIAVPLVYALLPSKTQDNYVRVLDAVKSAATRFRLRGDGPRKIMSDFEMGIINAGKTIFPNADVKCCFFHLGQASYRKVQQLGLQELYNDPEDRSIKEGVHMMLSLAFVPVEDMEEALRVVERETPRAIAPVIQYFDETCVRGPRARGARARGAARRPRYDVRLWNTYEATLLNEQRTNNISEGWHNIFQVGTPQHSI